MVAQGGREKRWVSKAFQAIIFEARGWKPNISGVYFLTLGSNSSRSFEGVFCHLIQFV